VNHVPGAPPPDVWAVLAAWRAAGRRFVLLTVVESRGFTPQKSGVHMLLDASGELAGTIGGGAIEQACLEEARQMLASGEQARTVRKQLTTELGMCCGGEMVVHLELLETSPRLLVYGAGHVARPLAALAATCGFAVQVADARDEWLNAERFPHAERLVREPDAHARELAAGWRASGVPESLYVVVTTHDHALDQRVVQELLPFDLRYLGLIGSLAKQRRFATRLRARGFDDARIARLHTPVGLAIGARTPEEIAVSIVAELVAVRRDARPELGWRSPAEKQRGSARAQTPESGVLSHPTPTEGSRT
jgi:xanthine dehydrogenase accessory factor